MCRFYANAPSYYRRDLSISRHGCPKTNLPKILKDDCGEYFRRRNVIVVSY
jgi:hypothetical protein